MSRIGAHADEERGSGSVPPGQRRRRGRGVIVLWIVLGGLVLLVGVPTIIGFMLPERYTGHAQADFDKSCEEIWDALLDYGKTPMSGKMMRSVEALPDRDGLPTWTEDMGHGELITVRTVEAERARRMVREMEDAAMAMRSRWTYILESVDAGCRLTMDAETALPLGNWKAPIFRFMMKLGGGVEKGLVIQMDMLASSLDTEARHLP